MYALQLLQHHQVVTIAGLGHIDKAVEMFVTRENYVYFTHTVIYTAGLFLRFIKLKQTQI